MAGLDPLPVYRRARWLQVQCGGWVVLTDWLFYRQPVGFTLGLMVAGLTFHIWLGCGRRRWSRPVTILTLLLCSLAGALIYQHSIIALCLSVLTLLSLIVYQRIGDGVLGHWLVWGKGLFTVMGGVWMAWILDLRIARRLQRRRQRAGRGTFGLRWTVWLLPIGLSAVFIGLFTVANPLLYRWLSDLGDWLRSRYEQIDAWPAPSRFVLWASVAVVAWGLCRTPRRWLKRINRPTQAMLTRALSETSSGRFPSLGLALRTLVFLNVVFAAQSLMDLGYLWGGWSLPLGMTYAEYAHCGAYPLVVTALLAGVLVLLGFRPGGPAVRHAWARRLVYLFVAQNILLLFSSGFRLSLYVEAYSLTRLRVGAGVWMLLVSFGFAWMLARIGLRADNRWLIHRVLVTATAVFYALAWIPVDRWIANYNVRHCAEVTGRGAALDTAYLESLGVASLPALAWAQSQAMPAEKQADLMQVRRRLEQELAVVMRDWRGYTRQRSWIKKATTESFRPRE